MKTKNIIKILKRSNDWRRGGKGEMPDPKIFGIAIDEAIEKLKQLKNTDEALNKACENLKKTNKEKNFLEDLNIAGVGELQFANLEKEHYKSMINEVEVLLDKGVKPHLIKQVIKNGKERAVIDLSIHTDLIFR